MRLLLGEEMRRAGWKGGFFFRARGEKVKKDGGTYPTTVLCRQHFEKVRGSGGWQRGRENPRRTTIMASCFPRVFFVLYRGLSLPFWALFLGVWG